MLNPRRCKGCKDKYPEDRMIKINLCWFHSYDCATQYAKQKAKDDKEKVDKKFKKDFYDNDMRTRQKAAKQACHLYIRTRDKNEPCICCGRPLGKNFDAGHFLESGNYSHLRYDERNIHAQSVYCNQHKGGNSDDYEGRLRLKIGNEAVDEMISSKNAFSKRTAQDYKAIEDHYKAKLKELKQ